ncbi:hypothetical protein J3Q64DRAFT_1729512 [Phycomyces blakesleeanus]|uniref:Actin-like ATPase domain-containing protein n=1 Tax=Phycomyces blakesleeanus TaxID=4837 RepID=A0ABR3B5G2_PHYBL
MSEIAQEFDPENYSFVIGIDFGTTFSGCSFVFTGDGTEEVVDITDWPNHGSQYSKVPTALLYQDSGHNLIAWGDDAINDPDQSDNPESFLVERFKLFLDKSVESMPELPFDLTAIQVITDYLTAFYEYTKTVFEESFPDLYDPSKCRYCLTVPTIWNDMAKAIMRKAAIQSGIVDPYDHPNRLMVTSESESAALYCEKSFPGFNLSHGDQWMLCDAGGGTVDLVVYAVDESSGERQLCEVTMASGKSCGSTFLDANMEILIKEKIGHLVELNGSMMLQLMHQFIEDMKPQFDNEEDMFMPLPSSILEVIEDLDSESEIVDGQLVFTANELREQVFEPVVLQVIELIEEQFQQSSSEIKALFLVGGFGQSKYLFQRIEEVFGDRLEFIHVPPRGDLAVARGAVIYGLNQQKVTKRILRRTYGIWSAMMFDPVLDSPEDQIVDGDGMSLCNNRFFAFAKMGDAVGIDECVCSEFKWYRSESQSLRIYTYGNYGDAPRYIDDPDIKLMCAFDIDFPLDIERNHEEGIPALVGIYFGSTEMRVEITIHDSMFTYTSAYDCLDNSYEVGYSEVPLKSKPSFTKRIIHSFGIGKKYKAFRSFIS